MTPPKITRPAVPEVQHTFPAWYLHKETGTTWIASRSDLAYCPEHTSIKFNYPEMPEVTDATVWERLPSGTKIEFTQP